MATKKVISRNYGNGVPDFSIIKKTNENFRDEFWRAFNFAHYELSSADLKKETLKFLKNQKSANYEKAKDLPEHRFTSLGKFCYIINHGGEVVDDAEKKIDEKIGLMILALKSDQKVETTEEEKLPVAVITIQDRLKEKAHEVAGEIDGWLDDYVIDKKTPIKEIIDFSNLFNRYELKAGHIRYLLSFFEKARDQIEEVIGTTDSDLKEAYSNYSKSELKKVSLFYKNLFAAGEALNKSSVVARKPRKKKPIDIAKLVSKLKYKKDEPAWGLVSLNPINIHGSKEVWVYNTKTRKLGCFKAIDADGLSVKGTSIVNFSTDSTEKTLRKPFDTLTEFKKASKVKLRTFLKDITTVETKLKGKINEYCIILRIDK